MTLAFSGFNFILHLAHQLASLSRSLCRYFAAALMSLSHKVTSSSSSSSCAVMFVSILVRLSFSVLCSKSSFVLSSR